MCFRSTTDPKLLKQKNRLYDFFKRSLKLSDSVLNAFLRVPREAFVPKKFYNYSYIDEPLPLSELATISAISMSLMLCEYAELKTGDIVLEIGTGSGYQAALISEIVCLKNEKGEIIVDQEKKVYTIEISQELFNYASDNLKKTCYHNCVETLLGDGTLGWPDKTIKFDAIIVTAAGSTVPKPLLEQLKVGGRLIIPIGGGWVQTLIRVRKVGDNDFTEEHLDTVRFVPLRGKYGDSNS